MAKKMFNTDEFDALFDDASESSDMFSGLFSENINPDTEKVTDPNEIVKGGDVDPDGTEPDVKSSFESLFEDDDEDDKPAEGEGTDEGDKPAEGEGTDEGDKPAEGEGTDEDDKPAESFESLFEDDDDSAEGEDSEGEADDVDGDSEDLDSDLFENFIL